MHTSPPRLCTLLSLLLALGLAAPALAQSDDTSTGDDDDSAASDDDPDSASASGTALPQHRDTVARDYSQMFRVTVDEKRNTRPHRTYERIYDASWCEDRGEGLLGYPSGLRDLEATLRALPTPRSPKTVVTDEEWRALEQAWRAGVEYHESSGVNGLPRTGLRDLRSCLDDEQARTKSRALQEDLDVCLAGGGATEASYGLCLVDAAEEATKLAATAAGTAAKKAAAAAEVEATAAKNTTGDAMALATQDNDAAIAALTKARDRAEALTKRVESAEEESHTADDAAVDATKETRKEKRAAARAAQDKWFAALVRAEPAKTAHTAAAAKARAAEKVLSDATQNDNEAAAALAAAKMHKAGAEDEARKASAPVCSASVRAIKGRATARAKNNKSNLDAGTKASLDALRDRVIMMSRTKVGLIPTHYRNKRTHLLADTCIEELEVVASPNSSLVLEMNTDFIGATKNATLSIQAFSGSQGVDVENYTTYQLGEKDSTRVIEDSKKLEDDAKEFEDSSLEAKDAVAATSEPGWSPEASLQHTSAEAIKTLDGLLTRASAQEQKQLRETASRVDALSGLISDETTDRALAGALKSQSREVVRRQRDPAGDLDETRKAGEDLRSLTKTQQMLRDPDLIQLAAAAKSDSVKRWTDLVLNRQADIDEQFSSIFTEGLPKAATIREEQAARVATNFPPGHVLLGSIPKLSHGDRLRVIVTFKPEGGTGNGTGELHYRKTFFVRIADRDMKVSVDATTVLTVRASQPASLGGNNGVFSFGSGATFLVGRGHADWWGDFFVPKFGATALLLTWADAGAVQIGVGPSLALFGGMFDVGVGWNLMSPYRDVAGKTYFHLGINFVQLGANIKALTLTGQKNQSR